MAVELNKFASLLKKFRRKSGLSQLQLSLKCSVSQKHISFLEINRASPSRPMVLAISRALNLSSNDQNTLLLSAGFAPASEETKLCELELAKFERTSSIALDLHEPYPAVLVDEAFNVLRANAGAVKLQTWYYNVDRVEDLPAIASNFVRGMFSPDGYRRYVTNWDDCAYHLYRGLSAQSSFGKVQRLLDDLEREGLIPGEWQGRLSLDPPSPFLRIEVEKDDVQLCLFSTVTTFVWPPGSSLRIPHIRSVFPADDATRRFFETE